MLFVALVLGARRPTLDRIGHDFLPFYAAGTFVREGNASAIYDIDSLRARERQIARDNRLSLGDGFGPFWNPPFYAMPFAPLSKLPFRTALLTWLGINLAALGVATALLCRMLDGAWQRWGLVPLLTVASTPFLLALTHGQNTFCSLLLLTLAVLAWRARRAVLTGAIIGLLAYKPQLAALVGLIALIDLGRRVALGGILSAGALVLAAGAAMPGIFETYQLALPKLLHFMQVEQPYIWERHVTLKAFWRLLIQGYAPGEASITVVTLASVCAAALSIALIVAAYRSRRAVIDVPEHRDCLIAAAIVSMPLVMPFYFDYDLLLLAIPAVLYAKGRRHGRWTVCAWTLLYVYLIINPDVAELTRVNLAVPLLACLATMLVARALQRTPEIAQLVIEEPRPAPVPFRAAA